MKLAGNGNAGDRYPNGHDSQTFLNVVTERYIYIGDRNVYEKSKI